MFEPLPARFDFPQSEEQILKFWDEHDIFEKSLALRKDAERFVFYEGPPTANGLPHPGHCLTRTIKDAFPRYQTMCGKLVERKAGWDTHGLPVEVEVSKELGIHSKDEIEAYGVEKFVRLCIESVFRYTQQWEHMTRRLGFWVNLEEAYVTFHQSYVESVWWGLKTLFERGLLYQGHKVVWWWAQGGTALSAGEVGEGYRTVDDPSVFVRFALVSNTPSEPAAQARNQHAGTNGRRDEGTQGEGEAPAEPPHADLPAGAKVSLLVWTTTPWTLISNHFAAVHPDLEYSLVHDQTTDEYLYIASPLVETIAGKVKHEFETVGKCVGADMIGWRYVPPFDCYYQMQATSAGIPPSRVRAGDPAAHLLGQHKECLRNNEWEHIGWRVTAADFVTVDSGSGLVHEAPAYGEVDFDLLQEERKRYKHPDAIPLVNAVAPDGTFTDEAPAAYRGRWVKDCDKDIIRELKDRGVLYHQETYRHEYPFCPRAEQDPLIQYARRSWFVRTSQFKDEFLQNNDAINWLPEHIKEGRFGDFLRNNVDWALSRERFWGTPLPIWVCEKTGRMEAIGSLEELKAKPGATDDGFWDQKAKEAEAEGHPLPDHLRVHKPYIDAWTYDSPFAQSEPAALNSAPRARMRRVPEVIDCWWDAGSMPFAQWGFPHQEGSVDTFTQRFPADFISEAIDQTRGWFYGLLAISTLLFGKSREEQKLPAADIPRPDAHPYKTCIVLGHVMGEDALKMSKRTKNYKEPDFIFDHYGADAMRWYFYSAQTPWTSIRFQETAIRDAHREFLVRLYNVFSFFNIYANIDGFAVDLRDEGTRERRDAGTKGRRDEVSTTAQEEAPPKEEPRASARAVLHNESGAPSQNPRGLTPAARLCTGRRPASERSQIDRWIISELHRTIRDVREKMDGFENYPAAGRLNEFVDALSNWYVRRSRDRFWKSEKDQDKWDAYNTLYEVLVALSKLIAPFTPFFAETMYQNLCGNDEGTERRSDEDSQQQQQEEPRASARAAATIPISVHLCDYPEADESLIDEALVREMHLVRQIVSTGRAARTAAKLKVRQPLSRVEITLAWKEYEAPLSAHLDLIAEELNVKKVEFTHEADHYVHYQVKPNFAKLGPKFGKQAPKIGAALNKLEHPAAARKTLTTDGHLDLTVEGEHVRLTKEDVEIRLEAREGWSASQSKVGVVVVSTEMTPELREEGLVRELIHHVQSLRKQQDLAYEARVTLYVAGPDEFIDVVRRFADTVGSECLAERIEYSAAPGETLGVKIEGHEIELAVATS